MDIDVVVSGISEIEPIDDKTFLVSLDDLDVRAFIDQIGHEDILDNISQDKIKEYLKEKENG